MLAACAEAAEERTCAPHSFEKTPYIVCTVQAGDEGLRLFHTAPDGDIYGQFDRLADVQRETGQDLIFAMNGGMYHDDRRPVGLYEVDGVQLSPLVVGEGPGNFGMVPNGVFVAFNGGSGQVIETEAYANMAFRTLPAFATQSGPMLVIDGALHPKFNADGPSKRRRNGVGVAPDGTIYFAISEVPVNFHSFARLFRDDLGTPNALYLDGVVSKLYAADLGRNEKGLDMGPIIGLVGKAEE